MNRTRDNAYLAHVASGQAQTQCGRIVALLKTARMPLLRDEIAGRLGILPSSVCGRMVELEQAGVVVKDAHRLNPVSGMECVTYRLSRPGDAADVEQGDLFGVAA